MKENFTTMTEEIKTKPLNKELLRCFVLIVLSIAVLTIAMIVSVFNPQILIIGAVIGTIEVFLIIFCVYWLFRFLYKEISGWFCFDPELNSRVCGQDQGCDREDPRRCNDISEMVLTSSAASQENAAASEELATQAQLLKELIENFKVDE